MLACAISAAVIRTWISILTIPDLPLTARGAGACLTDRTPVVVVTWGAALDISDDAGSEAGATDGFFTCLYLDRPCAILICLAFRGLFRCICRVQCGAVLGTRIALRRTRPQARAKQHCQTNASHFRHFAPDESLCDSA
jgi:hypothetical protein